MGNELRVVRLNFLVTEKECEVLRENAEKSGMTVSEYIRQKTIYQESK